MTHDTRVTGAILDTLEQAAVSDGHCYLPAHQLVGLVAARLDMARTRVEASMLDAARVGFVVLRDTRVYLPRLDRAERDVAASVARMMGRP